MRTMMRTLAAVLLASLMLFGGAAAQAHDELVSSDPAANATLTQAPAELNLTYSANLMNIEGRNRVRVVDSTGASVAEGEPPGEGERPSPSRSRSRMRAPTRPIPSPGA